MNFQEYNGDEIGIKELLRKSVADSIPGSFTDHFSDPCFISRTEYPLKSRVEDLPLCPQGIPPIIKSWAGLEQEYRLEDIIFLDLETTGLRRGSELAFMIGLGYYEHDNYIVEQIFLPDPDAEENSFDRLRELCDSHSLLITFNGKTFDLPVIESRLLYHQIWMDLRSMEHLDLLHIARRLWKRQLPSCAMESLEYYLLDQTRDRSEDIAGALIPQCYLNYLQTGDVDDIIRIFGHNRTDMLHTAALFTLICDKCDYPPQDGLDIRIDYYALAKLYIACGQQGVAKRILLDLLAANVITADILHELGMIYKREKDVASALQSFLIAADLQHHSSLLEAAKILEKEKEYRKALELSERLLALQSRMYPPKERLLQDLHKRIARLKSKLERST
nr:uncharacterized protein [Candidatus Cloacimonadota bacterium]